MSYPVKAYYIVNPWAEPTDYAEKVIATPPLLCFWSTAVYILCAFYIGLGWFVSFGSIDLTSDVYIIYYFI